MKRINHTLTTFFAALILLSSTLGAAEKLPKGLKVVGITVSPAKVELTSRYQYRQLLISAKLSNGQLADLTRMVKLASKPKFVAVSWDGVVRPVADGKGQVVFQYGKFSANVAVSVTGTKKEVKVNFVQDVKPVLSKMGCNQGTCHGSKDGKGNFKLSLRGYDEIFDHRALTDDIGARRFNRAAPDQSLMLLKATGSIPHVGGVRTKVGTPYYQIVRSWIANGGRLKLDVPRVSSIKVLPDNPIVPRAAMKQQMTVLATYTDGTVRDVTKEAFIESGDIEIIEANDAGLLTMLRKGEAPVLVRFEGRYAATTITVMGDRAGFVWNRPQSFNYIDKHVYNKLERVKVEASALCSDSEFIRRVYLDLTGLPPRAADVIAFLKDKQPTQKKRAQLVDKLIGNKQYVEHWTNKWADMLQVNRKFLGEEGAAALRNWIKQAVTTNKPYDKFAYEILTASGSTIENPPASYFKVLRNPEDLMENTTHLFLAVRFNCNKCHDHPFERWTQDQYYYLSSYFAQIGRKEDPAFRGKRLGGTAVEGAKPLVEVIFDRGSGEVKHLRTGETAKPSFPYEHNDKPQGNLTRREQLAHWITSKDNQYFARSYVNRLWGYMFGRGIIEPIDDIRAGNPPTNPQLLDALTADFIKNNFDVRHIIRTICNSRTYQHSIVTTKWNRDDNVNYSHATPRRLPAEVLFDSIHMATGSQLKLPGVPAGFRAAELPDAGIKIPFLDDFGKPVRESSCECERSSGMVLGPIMKLINGPTVANAIKDKENELAKLVAREKDDQKIIRDVFLRFLARYPTVGELKVSQQVIAEVGRDHPTILKRLTEYEKTLSKKQIAWEKAQSRTVVWTVVKPTKVMAQSGTKLELQKDGSILAKGKAAEKDIYTFITDTKLSKITGIRLEVLADNGQPAKGPGRAKNGNFVLNELRVNIAPKSDLGQARVIKLGNARADFNQNGYAVNAAIDGNPGTGWAISPQFGRNHFGIFEFPKGDGFKSGTRLTLALVQQFGAKHIIARFRVSITSSPLPLRKGKLPAALAKALAVPKAKRSKEQQALITKAFRDQDIMLKRLQQDVAISTEQLKNRRLYGIQDLAWALINNPAFLFNR